MKGYGQYCPIAQAAEIVTKRWTPLVLRELLVRGTRFNDIRRGVPLMSQSLLAERLRSLEQAGVVERHVRPKGGTEYQLTQAGRELGPVILQLETDPCLTDPGYEVDLYLASTLRTLTEIWMGDVSLRRASDDGMLEIHGRSDLRRCLRSWLELSPFAGVRRKGP